MTPPVPDNEIQGPSGSLSAVVRDLTENAVRAWRECENKRPPLMRTFTPRERAPREKALARFIDAVRTEAKHPPRPREEAGAIQKRILSGFEDLARTAFDWKDSHLQALLSSGFDRSALEFTRMARRFDPSVRPDDIFQGWRNVWVMNGLQTLLGLPVQLTPAIFAYSLLYPYTDNVLDDPAADEESKKAFNQRLSLRLKGREVAASSPQEKKVFDLVGLIEGQFDRSREPRVFESLLAIQAAQVRSVGLLRSKETAAGLDVLSIVLEKGGTSVLADGFLVAGSLTQAQVEFLFGFGSYLQLIDDLEDVQDDSEAGLLTVFSQAAGRIPLDSLTDQARCFGVRMLDGLESFGRPGTEPFQEVMRSSTLQALVTEAGRAVRYYSRPYIKALEAFSPFRYAFFDAQRRKLFRRRALLERLFESFASVSVTSG
jgi:hypothetical protein